MLFCLTCCCFVCNTTAPATEVVLEEEREEESGDGAAVLDHPSHPVLISEPQLLLELRWPPAIHDAIEEHEGLLELRSSVVLEEFSIRAEPSIAFATPQ